MTEFTQKIKKVPHEILMGETIKHGPVTEVSLCSFEDTKAVIRFDKPLAKLIGLDRIAEYQLLCSIQEFGISPEVLYFDPDQGIQIWRYVSGNHLKITTQTKTSRLQEIGKILKTIHQIKPTTPLPLFGSFIERYQDLLGGKENRKIIEAGFSLYEEISTDETPLVLSHNDLNPDNLLWVNSLFVLDWEYVSFNHPYFDLACLIEYLQLDHKNINELLIAYNTDLDPVDIQQLFLWREFNNFLTFFWLMIIKKYSIISDKERSLLVKLEQRLSRKKS